MVAFDFFVTLFDVLRAEVGGGAILLFLTFPHAEIQKI